MHFVNRQQDLNFLEDLYEESNTQAQLLILYGKARVGKTELIKHFYKNKPHIYYLASKSIPQDQIRTAADLFTQTFGDLSDSIVLDTWEKFFAYLGSKLRVQRTPSVIIFDEFANLVESDRDIAKSFEHGWNTHIKQTNTLMILMGSNLNTINKYILNPTSPFAKLQTAQWLMEPFSFREAKQYFKNTKFESAFTLYSIVGGVPAYLNQFDPKKSVRDNIEKNILSRNSFLAIEHDLLLADLFNEPRNYFTILKAIGLGNAKYADLLDQTGLLNNKLSIYLKNLIDLKIVKREVSITTPVPEKSKKGLYSISDIFLRFYFTFIFPNLSLVESGQYDQLFDQNNHIIQKLARQTYKTSAAEFIEELVQKEELPHFSKMGKFWDGELFIDLVGLNKKENTILFAEVDWENRPMKYQRLLDLQNRAKRVEWSDESRNQIFVLVSRGGFDQELRSAARKQEVYLIEKDEIVSFN